MKHCSGRSWPGDDLTMACLQTAPKLRRGSFSEVGRPSLGRCHCWAPLIQQHAVPQGMPCQLWQRPSRCRQPKHYHQHRAVRASGDESYPFPSNNGGMAAPPPPLPGQSSSASEFVVSGAPVAAGSNVCMHKKLMTGIAVDPGVHCRRSFDACKGTERLCMHLWPAIADAADHCRRQVIADGK